MKKSLIALTLGAGFALTLSSCRSTDADGYSHEEALPMNEYTVADGEIPIWLLEGDDTQIAAGETTRNNYPIPDSAVASTSSTTRQNQPDLAVNDTVVEKPLDTTSITEPSIPITSSSATNTGKTGTAKTTTSKKKPQGKKPSKKFNEPTLITYKVRPGDNLSTIAKRSRTTVAQIRRDSGIKGDLIYPGQIIKVRYMPKDYKPSSKTSGKSTTHTVRSGETISGIANRYGVGWKRILEANGMTEAQARKLQPGDKIKIPAKR